MVSVLRGWVFFAQSLVGAVFKNLNLCDGGRGDWMAVAVCEQCMHVNFGVLVRVRVVGKTDCARREPGWK